MAFNQIPEILGYKVDFLILRMPHDVREFDSTDSTALNTIRRELKLQNLVRVSPKMLRDDVAKIAIKLHPYQTHIEFEGQFFNEKDTALNKVRDFLHKLNSHLEWKNKQWRVSRIDIAIDFLDCQPTDLLPRDASKFWYSFRAKPNVYYSSEFPEVVETLYLQQKYSKIKAYRKDIEQDFRKARKQYYYNPTDPKFKDKPLTRFEVKLSGNDAIYASDILNSDLSFTETELCTSILSDWSTRRSIRYVNEADQNKARWKHYWFSELLSSGQIIESEEFQYEKQPVFVSQFKAHERFLKAAITSSPGSLSREELIARFTQLLDESVSDRPEFKTDTGRDDEMVSDDYIEVPELQYIGPLEALNKSERFKLEFEVQKAKHPQKTILQVIEITQKALSTAS